ncbi:hypothetical protein J8273_3940 [Carpediemonas membranifera]|uniref:Uncharacterized protein n=1 Tax=Carpediemonas membranifera TaxID=201153 RepID=A0A8J6ATN3_9EUKA|nr:hypothetical protein J8273_3940 [Carpediemonas membranifera]|eukprot:KAG9394306.1 hypothetical protein J8273_3940 [Carpediemonas membranifera]
MEQNVAMQPIHELTRSVAQFREELLKPVGAEGLPDDVRYPSLPDVILALSDIAGNVELDSLYEHKMEHKYAASIAEVLLSSVPTAVTASATSLDSLLTDDTAEEAFSSFIAELCAAGVQAVLLHTACVLGGDEGAVSLSALESMAGRGLKLHMADGVETLAGLLDTTLLPDAASCLDAVLTAPDTDVTLLDAVLGMVEAVFDRAVDEASDGDEEACEAVACLLSVTTRAIALQGSVSPPARAVVAKLLAHRPALCRMVDADELARCLETALTIDPALAPTLCPALPLLPWAIASKAGLGVHALGLMAGLLRYASGDTYGRVVMMAAHHEHTLLMRLLEGYGRLTATLATVTGPTDEETYAMKLDAGLAALLDVAFILINAWASPTLHDAVEEGFTERAGRSLAHLKDAAREWGRMHGEEKLVDELLECV